MNNRGFTLIEILVAMLIFSLVFLPLTAVLVAESKFERSYEQKHAALAIAKSEIEKAKRSFGKLEESEYRVRMAGKAWNVERSVDVGEGAILSDSSGVQLCTIRVRVSRDNDTQTLADLQVIKETYR
jgi:type II secretion system protein I